MLIERSTKKQIKTIYWIVTEPPTMVACHQLRVQGGPKNAQVKCSALHILK